MLEARAGEVNCVGVMVGGGEMRGCEEKRGETRKVREVSRGKTPRHDARSHRLETRGVVNFIYT